MSEEAFARLISHSRIAASLRQRLSSCNPQETISRIRCLWRHRLSFQNVPSSTVETPSDATYPEKSLSKAPGCTDRHGGQYLPEKWLLREAIVFN
eukprot:5843328-Amphidinium_carterae.1